MLVALGIAAMLVVVIGVAVVMAFARKQHVDSDAPPPSVGADFVAPVSSGGYRFRDPDESPEQFKARVDAENDAIESSRK
jgi:hypothetical protein